MYTNHSKPPFIDIALPKAHILPAHQLLLLYGVALVFDFLLLRNERLVNKVISPFQLRLGMAIFHTIIPMIYISGYPPANILFSAGPWFLASYSAHMPTEDLTVEKWVSSMFKITIIEDTSTSKSKIRIKGLAKVALGIMKISYMHLFIEPFLPHHAEYALEYAWLDPISLIYTVLYGIKAYCMLGMVDVFMGMEQALFAWSMVNIFNSPILSSSPRDFWSRRWNKVIRDLLHKQVFVFNKIVGDISDTPNSIDSKIILAVDDNVKTTATTTEISTPVEGRVTRSSARRAAELVAIENTKATTLKGLEDYHHITHSSFESTDIHDKDTIVTRQGTKQRSKSFWSTSQGRGLLAFIISGTFHELIIMSACRRITLENLVFFTLQGVACMIEVEIRQGALKQEPTGWTRALCVALQLLFMAVTGRLFLGPFLRYNFFTYN